MANAYAAPRTRIISEQIPAAGATADTTTVLGVIDEDEVVTAVTYIPVTTITGAATNNRTVSVVDKGNAGSGSTAPASLTFANGTNANALVETPITLNGTPANLQVTATDVLVFTSTHAGTGIADPGGLVRVTLGRR